MLKLIFVLFGGITGAGAASAWLLSTPAPSVSGIAPAALQNRLSELQRRMNSARQEGAHAQAEAENQIRHELATYRQHPDRPGTSSRP